MLEQLEQPEQSRKSSSDNKYTSLKLDHDLSSSSNASHTTFSSHSDISLFTPKKETETKILTPKQMLERLHLALAQVKVGNNSRRLLK